tara:strand:- start:56121 stop:56507 length:387 start_codon:yes stop_codon:yes gene_type:complete
MLKIMAGALATGGLILLGYVLSNLLHGGTSLNLLHPQSINISYSDLIVILLAAVTVILAALGTVIAVLAFVGWQNIGNKIEDSSEKIISDALAAEGKITETVKAEVRAIMYGDIQPVADEEYEDEEEV